MTEETVSDGSGRPKYVAWRSYYLGKWPQAMTHGKRGLGGGPTFVRDGLRSATEAYGLGPWLPPYEISHGGLTA